MTDEEEMRLKALEAALTWHTKNIHSAEEVVKAARIFSDFLMDVPIDDVKIIDTSVGEVLMHSSMVSWP